MIQTVCDKYREETKIAGNGSAGHDHRLRRRRLGLDRWASYGPWLIITKTKRKKPIFNKSGSHVAVEIIPIG